MEGPKVDSTCEVNWGQEKNMVKICMQECKQQHRTFLDLEISIFGKREDKAASDPGDVLCHSCNSADASQDKLSEILN